MLEIKFVDKENGLSVSVSPSTCHLSQLKRGIELFRCQLGRIDHFEDLEAMAGLHSETWHQSSTDSDHVSGLLDTRTKWQKDKHLISHVVSLEAIGKW